jgi:O-antigen/teichoic acid export membrane protein
MPFIFISAYLYGLFLFIEVKFKFADKLKNIALGVIIASVLNIGLNFIFIPLYGYQWAAFTTLVAYLFLLLYFYAQDSLSFFKNREQVKTCIGLILLLLIQVGADRILRNYYDLNMWQTIVEASLLFLVFLVLFFRKIVTLKIPV